MKKNEFIKGGIVKIEGIMVSKNAPCWDKFRFISGAKSKDQTRFFMQGIHIERAGAKTLLISTDGRRLHIATMDTLDIEPGDYEVKENTRDFMILYPMSDNIQYPNWKNIVKKLEAQKHFKIDMETKSKEAFSQTLYQFFRTTGAAINFEYLEPLGQHGSTWDVYFNSNTKAHTFVSGDLMAIIMPMSEAKGIPVETSSGPDFRDITPEPKLIDFKTKTRKKDKVQKIA